MTIKVENISNGDRAWHDLWTLLEAFCDMGVDSVKIEFNKHDYKTATSCYNSVKNTAKRNRFPVDVVMINGEVYLVSKL